MRTETLKSPTSSTFKPNLQRMNRFEVARMLDISVRTLDSLTLSGELNTLEGLPPCFRVSGRVFYQWNDVFPAFCKYFVQLSQRRPNHPLVRQNREALRRIELRRETCNCESCREARGE